MFLLDMMKDKLCGKITAEVVPLRPTTFTYRKTIQRFEDKRCKRTKNSVVAERLPSGLFA